MRKAGVHLNSTTSKKKSLQFSAYVGDIDIIGRVRRDLSAAFRAIERESTKMGLAANAAKMKYMRRNGSPIT